MSKNRNYDRPYNRNYNRDNTTDNSSREGERQHHTKKYSKSKILLKSSVWGLFIVLITLSAAFVIIKNKQQKKSPFLLECSSTKPITLNREIERFEVQNGVVTILTKLNSSEKQEIIRLDANCGNELNRIVFQVKN
jgi:hypothetical protein